MKMMFFGLFAFLFTCSLGFPMSLISGTRRLQKDPVFQDQLKETYVLEVCFELSRCAAVRRPYRRGLVGMSSVCVSVLCVLSKPALIFKVGK